jgi:competence protein ComEA
MRRPLAIALFVLSSFGSVARAEKSQLEGVVNLNTASADELRLIPGIGPARIRNILAYRRNHPFRTIEELARIKGIGRRMVRRWRRHLAVSGPSTAERVVRPDFPFVGPPPVPVPLPARPPTRRPPPTPAATGAVRPTARRGEPAHALSHRAPGNACLAPP